MNINSLDIAKFIPPSFETREDSNCVFYVSSKKHFLKAIDPKKMTQADKQAKYFKNLVPVFEGTNDFYVKASPQIAQQLRQTKDLSSKLSSKFGHQNQPIKITIDDFTDEENEILQGYIDELLEKELKDGDEEGFFKEPASLSNPSKVSSKVISTARPSPIKIEMIKSRTLSSFLTAINEQLHAKKKRAEEKKEAHQEEQYRILQEEIKKKTLSEEIVDKIKMNEAIAKD